MADHHAPATPTPPSLTPHRLWLGVRLDPPAALYAGALAGAIFLILEVVSSIIIASGTPLGPAYVTLHGLVGAEYVPGEINGGLIAAAIFLHFTLSIVLTLPLAAIVHPWKDRQAAVALGLVLGIALYFINYHVLALVMPVVAAGQATLSLINYAIFGMAAAGLYGAFVQRRKAAGGSPSPD